MMIFVTVGWQYGFERLVIKMDDIASKVDEEVVMQIGSTKYEPVNAQYFRFVETDDQILEYMRDARLVVSHAGAGSILTASSLGKPTIIVPRLKKFGEHIDDHQLEIAEVISEDEGMFVVYDVGDLDEHVREGRLNGHNRVRNPLLVKNLKKIIDQLTLGD